MTDSPVTRRDFLGSALLLPALFTQTSSARFIAAVPLGNPGGLPATPLGRLLGSGLDARLFTDLSVISRDKPATLITPTDAFYIRTAAPRAPVAPPVDLDLAALDKTAVRVGPMVLECAGNSDPANFGLLSAGTWEGIPIRALLDRVRAAAANTRVL